MKEQELQQQLLLSLSSSDSSGDGTNQGNQRIVTVTEPKAFPSSHFSRYVHEISPVYTALEDARKSVQNEKLLQQQQSKQKGTHDLMIVVSKAFVVLRVAFESFHAFQTFFIMNFSLTLYSQNNLAMTS